MVGAEAGCLSHLLLTEETAQAPSESGGELSPPTPRARSPAHQQATGLSTGGGGGCCWVNVTIFQLKACTGD